MRFGPNARHLAGADTEACPCCLGAVDRVKLAMGEVSTALAKPLPVSLNEHVAPTLDAVRASGRSVLVGLTRALRDLAAPPSVEAFRDAVAAFEGALDHGPGGFGEAVGDSAVRELRCSLRTLGDALAALAAELDDVRTRSWTEAANPTQALYCR